MAQQHSHLRQGALRRNLSRDRSPLLRQPAPTGVRLRRRPARRPLQNPHALRRSRSPQTQPVGRPKGAHRRWGNRLPQAGRLPAAGWPTSANPRPIFTGSVPYSSLHAGSLQSRKAAGHRPATRLRHLSRRQHCGSSQRHCGRWGRQHLYRRLHLLHRLSRDANRLSVDKQGPWHRICHQAQRRWLRAGLLHVPGRELWRTEWLEHWRGL